jgi:alkanesulfonate monooxygenase SsuD/methylene tetrahydromethanopterin reductase-like flavin-dependent oxidoreductase (luciferase family)
VRFGIHTPNFGEFNDPREMSVLAREAEDAGWDGFFLWDHVLWTAPRNMPASDPWVLLAAMAGATERIRLGPLVTPVPRRRPHTLARQTTTLDRFSGGRLIFGAGLGGDWFGDYSAFGEADDRKAHGEMLDEGLAVLAGLWSGEKFSFEGKHFTIKDVQFLPTPVQEPRIPVWLAGTWPGTKPFRRAAQWDGVFPLSKDDEPLQPDDYRALLAYIHEHRQSNAPFDTVHGGMSPGDSSDKAAEMIGPYAEAGVTWWLEAFWAEATMEEVRKRIEQGPPRL